MTFPERAIEACIKAMEDQKVSPFIVNNVLKCKRIDVTPIEKFLQSPNEMVRMFAVKIIGTKSQNLSVLFQAAKREENHAILLKMLKYIVKQKDSLQELAELIHSEDVMVKEEAIQMFRKAGRSDCLFTLLLEGDDKVVERVKKYIEEQR